MYLFRALCITVFIFALTNTSTAQEEWFTGLEVSIDQDMLADYYHSAPDTAHNYTVGLRFGFYGESANSTVLGLPWVRKKVDSWLVDHLIDGWGAREINESHNFVFTMNGFSPTHISSENDTYTEAVANGYQLSDDIPFSSFTGFRSTRRVEARKRYAHSASEKDIAFTTSFTFGFASLGFAQGLDDIIGGRRAQGNLWDRDTTNVQPTGQVNYMGMPMFMYSISTETVIWRPMNKVLLQVRPELNLGYYTDIGIGLDFGKVMNTNRLIDNLAYTDTNNPSMISVNNQDISLSVVGGVTARAVLYNAHINGWFGLNHDHDYSFTNSRKYLLEGYVGLKLQLFKRLEFTYSVSQRTAAINNSPGGNPSWGTLGFKFLIAEEGVGCYN